MKVHSPPSNPLTPDELESFRSRWRQEIQQSRAPQSPTHPTTTHTLSAAPSVESSPRHSEDNPTTNTTDKGDAHIGASPLDVYENAILKERQGSLSEAVVQHGLCIILSCQLSRLTVRNLRLYRRSIDKVGGAALPDHAATRGQ